MKPSEQWKMFADALEKKAKEMKESSPALIPSAIAIMACSREATTVQLVLEKDEIQAAIRQTAGMFESLLAVVGDAPPAALASMREAIDHLRQQAKALDGP